jgi:tetratricopeptide (TPR) repeat protein
MPTDMPTTIATPPLDTREALDAALRICDAELAARPDSPETHNWRGVLLSRLRRHDDAVASFDKAIQLRPEYFQAFNGRGNSLQALGRFAEAVASYDRALALNVNYPTAHANRGNALQALKRYSDAIESYHKAIALKPDHVDAYNNRGTAFRRLGYFEEALADFDKAIALAPNRAGLHSNRGNALQELGRYEEAVENYDTAISLDPQHPGPYSNRGLALRELGRFDDAMASFEKALELKPDYYEAIWNRALLDLEAGRFDRGWRGCEARKKKTPPVGVVGFEKPEWLGDTRIAGRTILVHWEQGFGDVIQFSRYIKKLSDAGAKVKFAPQKELQSLMQGLSGGADIVDLDADASDFDVHCSLQSLPLVFNTDITTIPNEVYLAADRDRIAMWAARLPGKSRPRVGVVWKASPKRRERSLELDCLHRLLDPRIEVISLQKEVTDAERAWLNRMGIIRVEDLIGDFSDTAALCMLVDLVISVDTSVAHLAGALGVPVWLLLSAVADWRWLRDREDSPWYPSMRLFRQRSRGDWDSVLRPVERELINRFFAPVVMSEQP